MSPEQVLDGPVVTIGDRCVIGKGSGVVGHQRVEIGDDVWTGHYVYVTDANHGYADPVEPVGLQFAAPRPVRIGSGSWLGHGALVLGGVSIGEHVVYYVCKPLFIALARNKVSIQIYFTDPAEVFMTYIKAAMISAPRRAK